MGGGGGAGLAILTSGNKRALEEGIEGGMAKRKLVEKIMEGEEAKEAEEVEEAEEEEVTKAHPEKITKICSKNY